MFLSDPTLGPWLSTIAPANPSPSWPDLPPDLADLVLRRLSSSHTDRVHFASVCRHWNQIVTKHSAPSLPPPLPWLLQFRDSGFRPLLKTIPDGKLHPYVFSEDGTHMSCQVSFGSWLLLEGKIRRRNTLRNPLTGATVQLPSLCNQPEERLSYYERRAPSGIPITSTGRFGVRKVMVCSPELVAAIVRYYHCSQDIVVCCRPGMSSSWSTGLFDNSYCLFQDIAFYDGRVYAVTDSGDLFVHEVAEDINHTVEPRICRLEKVIQGNNTLDGLPDFNQTYLVISCTGKLLMVQRKPHCQYFYLKETSGKMFKVFEADLEKSQWLEVESLGDQVLFVSFNCSRAIRASDHGSYLQGSTIYFLPDTRAEVWSSMERLAANGVYDMSRRSILPISLGEFSVSSLHMAAWFFP